MSNEFVVCALYGFAGQRHRSHPRQMAPEVMHHGTQLQMSHFWKFPSTIFRPQLAWVTDATKNKTSDDVFAMSLTSDTWRLCVS